MRKLLVIISAVFPLSACNSRDLATLTARNEKSISVERSGNTVQNDIGNASIQGIAINAPLVITTSQSLAGAIGSLSWNHKEFINAYDHGRELQSAISYDGLGECLNPTEAGSVADGTGITSTSRLLTLSASENQLSTKTLLAYWLKAGSPYPSGCFGDKDIISAQNRTNLSGDVLNKTVTIGSHGLDNVIEYSVKLTTPDAHASASFEILTGYMNSEFSASWSFDPATDSIANWFTGALPIIVGTPDQQYVMGIYVPRLAKDGSYYGYGAYQNVNPAISTYKWNAMVALSNLQPGSYSYTSYVIVGTLPQVRASMVKLYKLLENPVTGFIDSMVKNADGSATITGWACSYGRNESLQIDLYLNGPAGIGHFVNRAVANLRNEVAVDLACGTSISSGHRFQIEIPIDVVNAYPDQRVFVHGISVSGGPNFSITGSGIFQIGGGDPSPNSIFQVGARLYFENESNHYCWFSDWSKFMKLTGLSSTEKVAHYSSLPWNSAYDGACH